MSGQYYGDYIYWNNTPPNWSVGSTKISLGKNAGSTSQGTNAVAIGEDAGQNNQVSGAIAIGYQAGCTAQGANAIAIGYKAGSTGQGPQGIAIGYQAGITGQARYSIAIGADAGCSGEYSVAIGPNAGCSGAYSTSIGVSTKTQFRNSAAIGPFANNDKADNTIVIGTSGGSLQIGPGTATIDRTTDIYFNGRIQADMGISVRRYIRLSEYQSYSGITPLPLNFPLAQNVLIFVSNNISVNLPLLDSDNQLGLTFNFFKVNLSGNTIVTLNSYNNSNLILTSVSYYSSGSSQNTTLLDTNSNYTSLTIVKNSSGQYCWAETSNATNAATNYVTINGPNSITGNKTFTVPVAFNILSNIYQTRFYSNEGQSQNIGYNDYTYIAQVSGIGNGGNSTNSYINANSGLGPFNIAFINVKLGVFILNWNCNLTVPTSGGGRFDEILLFLSKNNGNMSVANVKITGGTDGTTTSSDAIPGSRFRTISNIGLNSGDIQSYSGSCVYNSYSEVNETIYLNYKITSSNNLTLNIGGSIQSTRIC